MPDADADQVFDVLSVLDSQDQPRLNNCTLQIGEVALEFKNGRSKVPAAFAPEVARHPLVTLPGYNGPVAPAVPNASAELPSFDREQQLSPQEREARVRAAAEYLQSEGVDVPAAQQAVLGEALKEDPARKALEERVAELEELVKQATLITPEGKAEPKAGKAEPKKSGGKSSSSAKSNAEAPAAADDAKIPDGFEPETSEGKPRCWARKGDGSQCTNASVEDSHACGLPAHQKLLAK